jgi:hypothetical protein
MPAMLVALVVVACLPAAAGGHQSVRVATYNIKFFRSDVGQGRLDNLKAVVAQLDVDIIGLYPRAISFSTKAERNELQSRQDTVPFRAFLGEYALAFRHEESSYVEPILGDSAAEFPLLRLRHYTAAG